METDGNDEREREFMEILKKDNPDYNWIIKK